MLVGVILLKSLLLMALPVESSQGMRDSDGKKFYSTLHASLPQLPLVLLPIIMSYAKKPVWKVACELVSRFHHTDCIETSAWSARGKFLAVAHSNGIEFFDEMGKCWAYLPAGGSGRKVLAWHPVEDLIAVGNGEPGAMLYEIEREQDGWTTKCQGAIGCYCSGRWSCYISSMVWMPRGKRYSYGQVIGCREGSITLRDFDFGEIMCLEDSLSIKKHTGAVTSLACSRGGSYCVSGGEDGVVRVWETEQLTTLQILTRYDHEIASVAWSPSGKYIASGSCGCSPAVRMWALRNGQFEAIKINKALAASRDENNNGIRTKFSSAVRFFKDSEDLLEDLLIVRALFDPSLITLMCPFEDTAVSRVSAPVDVVGSAGLSPCGTKLVVSTVDKDGSAKNQIWLKDYGDDIVFPCFASRYVQESATWLRDSMKSCFYRTQ